LERTCHFFVVLLVLVFACGCAWCISDDDNPEVSRSWMQVIMVLTVVLVVWLPARDDVGANQPFVRASLILQKHLNANGGHNHGEFVATARHLVDEIARAQGTGSDLIRFKMLSQVLSLKVDAFEGGMRHVIDVIIPSDFEIELGEGCGNLTAWDCQSPGSAWKNVPQTMTAALTLGIRFVTNANARGFGTAQGTFRNGSACPAVTRGDRQMMIFDAFMQISGSEAERDLATHVSELTTCRNGITVLFFMDWFTFINKHVLIRILKSLPVGWRCVTVSWQIFFTLVET
jgi:hypothetical protein